MRVYKLLKSVFLSIPFVCSGLLAQPTTVKNIESRVDSVLSKLTIEEKIGQLNQLSIEFATGSEGQKNMSLEDYVRKGKVGSFLNTQNMEYKIKLQKIAMKESRAKIPLIFALDVIHGYKVVFPIPLAQSCSWDLEAIEKAERSAATLAAAHGIHWTFAPMMDVSRDPRWGRVMEGSGEDTWLGAKIAAARVKGFQGEDLSKPNTILACAKHFAAYGGAESGREYNAVEMSERQLREFYLPPFKAAAAAGIGTFMNSFNTISAVPASGHKHLVQDILKTEWGFKGFVVSDWESISEMINHGVAADSADAALLAMKNQTSDMDMVSQVYANQLKKLVDSGKLDVKNIDDAVRRVLRMKFALGLFDDPYRYFNTKTRDTELKNPKHNLDALDVAKKSMVLLKNDNNILPLSKNLKKIAVIGPFAEGSVDRDYMSFWTFGANQSDVVNLVSGIKKKISSGTILITASVCGFMGACSDASIQDAVSKAANADVIVLALGENGERNGECRSRTELRLPGTQSKLLSAIAALGKPTVLVLFNGRPLVLGEDWNKVPAVLEAWQPGTQAGNAVAEVLFGDYNPAGKLTMSWPINEGQIPVYYNQLPTGRPAKKEKEMWKSVYSDIANEPFLPFGYGLSYTTFSYSDIKLSTSKMLFTDKLEASVTISNTGKVAGEEVVQLYIRDMVADVSRPVKELRGFKKIFLNPGESKEVRLELNIDDLKYWNADLVYKADEGEFLVMIGPNSKETKSSNFRLIATK